MGESGGDVFVFQKTCNICTITKRILHSCTGHRIICVVVSLLSCDFFGLFLFMCLCTDKEIGLCDMDDISLNSL